MKVKTKLNVGDKAYFMNGDAIEGRTIERLSIEVHSKGVVITYHLDGTTMRKQEGRIAESPECLTKMLLDNFSHA